jgi:glycogen debranching enzyme
MRHREHTTWRIRAGLAAAVCSVAWSAAWGGEPPRLRTGDAVLDRAFTIALADVEGNVKAYRAGVLEAPSPVLMAGAGYTTPWTRDAAINTWNGAGLLWPEVARNTLRSEIERRDGRLVVGGQYWDAIVWAVGAWHYYLFTGDRPFLEEAAEATANTLADRERDERDPALGLFRGPAVYGDGVAAYPDRYANQDNSAILDWPKANADRVSRPGYGLPMHTLSTNSLYVHAYELLRAMHTALGRPVDPAWSSKAEDLRRAINQRFWSAELGRYLTLVDPWGSDDRQEAIGLAFSVLFGVADEERRESIFRRVALTPAGIPCLWPTYPRYAAGGEFGRHSGAVWPHAQAFWADAAARSGHPDLFAYELTRLAAAAVRHGQFHEIYHPVSGEPYGGRQELKGRGIVSWDSEPHQTWSATGFLRLVLYHLAGLRFDEAGVGFAPTLPGDLRAVELTGVAYRGAVLDVQVRGAGRRVVRVLVNGRPAPGGRVPRTATGRQRVEVELGR